MNLFRLFPATLATFAVLFGGVFPAFAVHQLESSDDVDGICSYSDPQHKGSSEDDGQDAHQYQTARRAMAQKVMEVTVSAEQLAVIGYDHITGVLSISGFRDYPLFSGQHFLRFHGGCALHFEVSETLARDWSARLRMGGAGLKIGFMLSAHDNYERTFCESVKSVSKDGVVSEDVSGGTRAGALQSSRQVVLSDLLYATLIDADGKALSTFHTELGHRVYLRKASQVDGQTSATVPRVEVTSLVWAGGVKPAVIATESIETDSKSVETPEDALNAWWRSSIEAAAYPCYQRGLARNGRLQGAFVIRMPATGRGSAAAEILLDTLQMDDVSSCILERVRAIPTPASDTRRWTSVKATMLFMLH